MRFNTKISLLLSIFIFTFLTFSLLHAQNPHFRTYSIQEGLPQSSVYSLLIDNTSQLWIGTQGGVASFDGQNFTTYTQKEGLGDNHVTTIYQDNDNQLWVGHRYTGISIKKGNRFINFGGDTIKTVNTLLKTKKNELLVGTNTGLFVIDTEKNEVTSHHFKANFVSQIFTRNNEIFVVGTGGLLKLDTNNFLLDSLLTPSDLNSQAVGFANVKFIDNNTLWAATRNGLFKVSLQSAGKATILEKYTVSEISILNGINSLKIANDNSLWVATMGGAVHIKDKRIETFTTQNGLAGAQVASIEQDHEGQIWMGTHMGKGLSLFLGRYFEQIKQAEDEIVLATTVDNEGGVWTGTLKGVYRYTFTDKYQSNIANVEKMGIFQNQVVNALYTDSRGLVWLSTRGKLACYDPKNKQITDYSKLINIQPNTGITSINEDKDNHIWVSAFRQKCMRLTMENGKAVSKKDFTTNDGLVSNTIWSLYKDNRGNLWFGSNDNGLSWYDGEKFYSLTEKDGLPNNRPASITQDIDGNMWFASIGGGAFRYDGKDFKVYTTKNGITSDNPYLIVGDDLGQIWIGTNNGVNCINPKTDEIKVYTFKDGFTGTETNQSATFKDKNGNLWFGTINGLMKCNPTLFEKNTIPPPIFLENVRLFLRDTVQINNTTLDYNKNYLTFNFKGISYKNPSALRYQYRLQGLDAQWSPLTEATLATYTSLPHGDYTFEVRAINADNVMSENYATTSFSIAPAFWNRLWFQIVAGLLVCLVVWGGHNLRMKKIKNDKLHLERIVEIRTEEINAQKEEIEATNSSLIERNAEVMQQKEEILAQRDDLDIQTKQLSAIYLQSEKQNKKISQSIRYAQRIQQAMLPSDKLLSKMIPNHFVYYQPKDIVSGDSYWIGKTKDKILIAGIDCTGHGVPGAIMSMAANSALTQVVEAEGEWQPHKVLSRLHVLIRQNLSQSETNIKDGMDIILCAFDATTDKAISSDKHEMYFAGAKRPLIYVQDGKLNTIKGDRHSIGGEESDIEFTLHTLTSTKDTTYYLTSDGYQDQFGGKNNKKLGRQAFYDMIHKVSNQSLEEQKEYFTDFMKKWKAEGNEEQIDDQFILGFKWS
ncbi:two-component regulator propeller domain-containing protein [Bernardetia sp.]|uniref:two-component regulator propeller domain-containing protein n=1 Tax=Bernardetia sp. TaxID=1937974 RepID=UPI0025BB96FD|nr:two-component regulator propeller domain-containing protein [Bernardetia sp.]